MAVSKIRQAPPRKATRAKTKRTIRRPKTAAEKMRAFRSRMRAKGFKLVQRWVIDTSRPEFIAEARRQSRLISGTPEDRDANRALAALAEDSALWS